MNTKHVKILLWKAREEHGNMSYQELSKLTGISTTSLWRIDNGEKSPTLDELYIIARVLGIRMTDLYDADNK